jgi:predicted Zn-dependent protease
MKRIAGLFLMLVIALGFCGGCCQTNPVTGRSEFNLYSDQEEISLGQSVVPEVEQQFDGIYNEAAANSYVNEVGQKMAVISHRQNMPYSFKVLNTSVVNAFALPGGPIYITRGLLVKLTNEAQLAAVLGHELAHINARHSTAALSKAMAAQILIGAVVAYSATKNGGNPSDGAIATAVAAQIVLGAVVFKAFSRSDEYQSDQIGTDYAYAAGYNPLAMVQLFEVFKQMEDGEGSSFAEFFSTHPLTTKRIEEVEAEVKQKYPDAQTNSKLVYNEARYNRQIAKLRLANDAYERYYDKAEAIRGQNPGAALDLYNQAIGADGSQALFYVGRGRANLELNKVNEAHKDFARAASMDRASYPAQVGLGVCFLLKNNPTQARQSLANAIQMVPGAVEAHFYLAESEFALGNGKVAAEEYRVVLGIVKEGQMADAATKRLQELGQ